MHASGVMRRASVPAVAQHTAEGAGRAAMQAAMAWRVSTARARAPCEGQACLDLVDDGHVHQLRCACHLHRAGHMPRARNLGPLLPGDQVAGQLVLVQALKDLQRQEAQGATVHSRPSSSQGLHAWGVGRYACMHRGACMACTRGCVAGAADLQGAVGLATVGGPGVVDHPLLGAGGEWVPRVGLVHVG